MEKIHELMHRLRIKRTYMGYYYLSTAIYLVVENEERLLYIHKWLYAEIARIYNTTPYCVERNIRTVKNHLWEKGHAEILSEIAGCPIREKPSNSEFIDILSCYIKKQIQTKIS